MNVVNLARDRRYGGWRVHCRACPTIAEPDWQYDHWCDAIKDATAHATWHHTNTYGRAR